MRKLVVAVILFSFLGYGPLKSLFQDLREKDNAISSLMDAPAKWSNQNETVMKTISDSLKLAEGALKELTLKLGKVNDISLRNHE